MDGCWMLGVLYIGKYWMSMGRKEAPQCRQQKLLCFVSGLALLKKMGGWKSGPGANACRRSQTSLIYKHGSDPTKESDHRKKCSLFGGAKKSYKGLRPPKKVSNSML